MDSHNSNCLRFIIYQCCKSTKIDSLERFRSWHYSITNVSTVDITLSRTFLQLTLLYHERVYSWHYSITNVSTVDITLSRTFLQLTLLYHERFYSWHYSIKCLFSSLEVRNYSWKVSTNIFKNNNFNMLTSLLKSCLYKWPLQCKQTCIISLLYV
jgi:hypothetical protein